MATAALVVWWLTLLPLLFGLWPRDPIPAVALVGAVLLAAFAVWTAISLGWAEDDGRGYLEFVRAVGYLGLFVLTIVAARRGSAGSWLGGMAIGVGVVVAIALLSRLEPSLIDNGRAEVGNAIGEARGRLAYPIGYWNAFGGLAAVATLLPLAISLSPVRRGLRCAGVALMPIAMLAIFLSSSRGAVVALLAGLVVLFVFSRDRIALFASGLAPGIGGGALIVLASSRDAFIDDLANGAANSQGDQMLVFTILACLVTAALWLGFRALADGVKLPALPVTGAVAIVVVVAVAGGVAVDLPQRLDHFNDLPSAADVDAQGGVAHLASGSGSGRWQFWQAAADAFEAHPLRGQGAGSYEAYWTEHGSLVAPIKNAHSLVLETLAELGLVGAALLIGFLLLAAGRGAQLAAGREPWAVAALGVLAVAVTQSMFDWTWELPAAFGPAIVAAGLLLGPSLAPSRQAKGRWGWGLAAILVGLASIWSAGVLLLSQTKLQESQAAFAGGSLAAARAAAEDASTLQPWSSEPRLQLALIDESAGDIALARAEIQEAIGKAPNQWQLWLVATRLDVKAGRLDQARTDGARLEQLNPRAGFLQEPASAVPEAEAQ
ncbi:hypothetical protein BH10ACT11_BH10ACT11_05630 [soil metagenome]